MIELKLSEISPDQLDKSPVYYLLRNTLNGCTYVGLATHGLKNRLFNNVYGYVTDVRKNYISNLEQLRSEYEGASNLVMEIKVALAIYGLENFVVSILGGCDDPTLSEEVLIRRYNSILNGYNKSLDGEGTARTKYHLVTYCDDKGRLINLPEIMNDDFINLGLRRSSRVWINKDGESMVIHDYELDNYLSMGYSKGRIYKYTGVKRTLVNKDGVVKFVTYDEAERLVKESGYSMGRGIAYNLGKITVSKDGVARYINRDELDEYLSKGYSPGFSDSNSNHKPTAQDQRIMTDPDGNYVYVHKDEVDEYLNKGYIKGHPDGYRTRRSKRFAVNDGTKYWYVESQEEADRLVEAQGLKYGMTPRKVSPSTGRIAINKDGEMKRIKPHELEEFISMGWKKGALRKSFGGSYKKYREEKEKLNNE